MFHGIGTEFQGLQESAGTLTAGARVGKTIAHGVAGGISSVLNGGKYGHGFASAGFTQALAPGIDRLDKGSRFSAGRVAAAAVVGGTASSITGGKFANGAVTGAFSRAFNDESHYQKNKTTGPSAKHPDEVISEMFDKGLTKFRNLLDEVLPDGVVSVGGNVNGAFGPFAVQGGGGVYLDFDNLEMGLFSKSALNGVTSPSGGIEGSAVLSVDYSPSATQFFGRAVETGLMIGPVGADFSVNAQGVASGGFDIGWGYGASVVEVEVQKL